MNYTMKEFLDIIGTDVTIKMEEYIYNDEQIKGMCERMGNKNISAEKADELERLIEKMEADKARKTQEIESLLHIAEMIKNAVIKSV